MKGRSSRNRRGGWTRNDGTADRVRAGENSRPGPRARAKRWAYFWWALSGARRGRRRRRLVDSHHHAPTALARPDNPAHILTRGQVSGGA